MVSLFLAGCMGYPENIRPVTDFELDQYLGKWYEIARLDHRFERGLERVTAEYTLLENGGIQVKNRGFSIEENRWKEAVGRADFAGRPDEGYLKVSFFGPFYSAYVIFELEKENYQYAFVSGYSDAYLWLLSRTPTVSDQLKAEFEKKAAALGFPSQELIWVRQE